MNVDIERIQKQLYAETQKVKPAVPLLPLRKLDCKAKTIGLDLFLNLPNSMVFEKFRLLSFNTELQARNGDGFRVTVRFLQHREGIKIPLLELIIAAISDVSPMNFFTQY